MDTMRERVEREVSLVISKHEYQKPAVDAIMAIVDEDREKLVAASTDTLAILEVGYGPGLHHMETLDGRAAWLDRMMPVRERLRAALSLVGK